MHENMFSMSLDFHPRSGPSKTVIAWLVVVAPLYETSSRSQIVFGSSLPLPWDSLMLMWPHDPQPGGNQLSNYYKIFMCFITLQVFILATLNCTFVFQNGWSGVVVFHSSFSSIIHCQFNCVSYNRKNGEYLVILYITLHHLWDLQFKTENPLYLDLRLILFIYCSHPQLKLPMNCQDRLM